MAGFRLPQSFSEWRYCIEVLCNTPLTPTYVEQRIQQLKTLNNKLDKRFVELYGEEHRRQVLSWFERVKGEALWTALPQ